MGRHLRQQFLVRAVFFGADVPGGVGMQGIEWSVGGKGWDGEEGIAQVYMRRMTCMSECYAVRVHV